MGTRWTNSSQDKETAKGARCYRFVFCRANTITELMLDMIADKPKTKRRRKK